MKTLTVPLPKMPRDSKKEVDAFAREHPTLIKGKRPDPCVMVIFGATGDLTHRKLIPALYNLAKGGWLPERFAVIGFSRSLPSVESFRDALSKSVKEFSRTKPIDSGVWADFARRIYCAHGNYDDPDAYKKLRRQIEEVDRKHRAQANRLYYLATPPLAFPPILKRLHESDLLYKVASRGEGRAWSRVVIEKPIGRDLETARELNNLAAEVLDESQIFRIDHYLGKETVQNILVFRFGNSIFEPIWNRKFIDHVQITAAEDIGIGDRGRFYDQTGVLRDVVQNHLLQILALCTMEPPISFDADEIRNQKGQIFRSLRTIRGEEVDQQVVWGQYRGYREEPHVSPQSRTPTFVALKVMIDNWRWQGVPFYLRAGKRLRKRATEVAFQFLPIPFSLFGSQEVCQCLKPNVLRIRIQPDEGIALQIESKVPGEDLTVGTVQMDFSYSGAFARPSSDAYERLLLDCMRGDATLFARRDNVEEAWRFITPILEHWESKESPIPLYEPGSSGPKEADELLWRDHRSWKPVG